MKKSYGYFKYFKTVGLVNQKPLVLSSKTYGVLNSQAQLEIDKFIEIAKLQTKTTEQNIELITNLINVCQLNRDILKKNKVNLLRAFDLNRHLHIFNVGFSDGSFDVCKHTNEMLHIIRETIQHHKFPKMIASHENTHFGRGDVCVGEKNECIEFKTFEKFDLSQYPDACIIPYQKYVKPNENTFVTLFIKKSEGISHAKIQETISEICKQHNIPFCEYEKYISIQFVDEFFPYDYRDQIATAYMNIHIELIKPPFNGFTDSELKADLKPFEGSAEKKKFNPFSMLTIKNIKWLLNKTSKLFNFIQSIIDWFFTNGGDLGGLF